MNPHNSLKKTYKGLDHWKCKYCGMEGTYAELNAVECPYEYPPCKYCGETPLCAPDCKGIVMALTDPGGFIRDRKKNRI